MKTYKLHNGLPKLTKLEWISYANDLYETILISRATGTDKGSLYQESLIFYNKILKTFKIKTF